MPGAAIQSFKRTNIIFFASAAIVLALSIYSYHLLQQQRVSSDLVNRSYAIASTMHEAASVLTNAESGQRGFLLTNDTTFIRQFTTSIARIPSILSRLDSLVSDKQQDVNLQNLTNLLQLRVNWMNLIIDSAGSQNAASLDYLLTESNRTAELTQHQIQLMEAQEREVLRHRLNIKKRQDDISTVFVLIFSVVSLIMLVLSFSWLKKENLLRNRYALSSNILEQKVAERTAELREANQKLNEQNETLARKNAELKSFTYIASHDLKEPLRKIATFSERILTTEEASLTDKGRFYFQRIRAAIERMQNLIEAVFAYTQTETGIEFKPTDLNDVTRHAIDTLDEAVMQSKAVIVYDALPTVYAIPHQIEQLFTNLISNSIKYARTGVRPHIVIAAEKETFEQTEGWNLYFKDNGIGFDEKYKDKIFQIFQRLHGNAEYSGTGIGLAICKKIVDNHKGKITVHSKEGEGTEFVIWLPAGEPSEQSTQ